MKPIPVIVIVSIMLISCGSYTPTEPNLDPYEGYWSGETGQYEAISFKVTSDMTMGDIELEIRMYNYSTVNWTIGPYEELSDDWYWSRDIEGESSGGHIHKLFIEGQFISSDSCSGKLTAESETYLGGYYVETPLTLTPD